MDDFIKLNVHRIELNGNEQSTEHLKDLTIPYEKSSNSQEECVFHSGSSNSTLSNTVLVDCIDPHLCLDSSKEDLVSDIFNSTQSNYNPADCVDCDSSEDISISNLVPDSSYLNPSNAIPCDGVSLNRKSSDLNCMCATVEEPDLDLKLHIKEQDTFSSDIIKSKDDLYESDSSNVTQSDNIPVDCLSLYRKCSRDDRFEPTTMDETVSFSRAEFNTIPLDYLRLYHKSTEPNRFDSTDKVVCAMPYSKLNLIDLNCSYVYECLADDEASSICSSDFPRDNSPPPKRDDWTAEDWEDDCFCHMGSPLTEEEFESDLSALANCPYYIILSIGESPGEDDELISSSKESSNSSASGSFSSSKSKSCSSDVSSNSDKASSSDSGSNTFPSICETNKDGKSTPASSTNNRSSRSSKLVSKRATSYRFGGSVQSASGSSSDSFPEASLTYKVLKSPRTSSSDGQSSRTRRSGSNSKISSRSGSPVRSSSECSNDDFPEGSDSNKDGKLTHTSNSDNESSRTSRSGIKSVTERIFGSPVWSSSRSTNAFTGASESNEDAKSPETSISDGQSSRARRFGSKTAIFCSILQSSSQSKPSRDEASSRSSTKSLSSPSKSNIDGSFSSTSSSDNSRGGASGIIYSRVPPSSSSNSDSCEEPSFSRCASSSKGKFHDDRVSETISDIERELESTRIAETSSTFYLHDLSSSETKSFEGEALELISDCENHLSSISSADSKAEKSSRFYIRDPSSTEGKSTIDEASSCRYSSEASSSRYKFDKGGPSCRISSSDDQSSTKSRNNSNSAVSRKFCSHVPSSRTRKSHSNGTLLSFHNVFSSTSMSKKDATFFSSSDDESSNTRKSYSKRVPSRKCNNHVPRSRREVSNADDLPSSSKFNIGVPPLTEDESSMVFSSDDVSSNTSKPDRNGTPLSRFNTSVPPSTKDESSMIFSSDDGSSSTSRSRSCESSSSTGRSRSCEDSSSCSEFVTSEYESLSCNDSESEETSTMSLMSTSEDSDWETYSSSMDENLEYKILISASEDEDSDCLLVGIIDMEASVH